MEKEDKMIRELLEKGYLKPAPPGFTESVMQQVAATSPGRDFHVLTYPAIVLAAIAAGIGAIYFTDASLLSSMAAYLLDFFKPVAGLFGSFSGIFSTRYFDVTGGSLFPGILIVVALLLGFDSLIVRRKRAMNILG